MKYLHPFIKFNENKYYEFKDLIEDCFLDFCDEYDQRMEVNDGYFLTVDGVGLMGPLNFVVSSAVEDAITSVEKMTDKKAIKKSSGYRLTLFRKSVTPGNPIIDQSDIWREEMPDDFNKCIKRIEELSDNKLILNGPSDVNPTYWQITCLFEVV